MRSGVKPVDTHIQVLLSVSTRHVPRISGRIMCDFRSHKSHATFCATTVALTGYRTKKIIWTKQNLSWLRYYIVMMLLFKS